MANPFNPLDPSVIPLEPPPFNPFSDLTIDDLAQLARIRADVAVVRSGGRLVGGALSRDAFPLGTGATKAGPVLRQLVDAALDRLAGDGAFLAMIAEKFGEAGFEYVLAHAGPADPDIQATLRKKMELGGGFVPTIASTMSTAQAQFNGLRSTLDPLLDELTAPGTNRPVLPEGGPDLLCVLALAEMVGGAVYMTEGLATVAKVAPVGAAESA